MTQQAAAGAATSKYQGWVKSINAEKGFGFIMCPQTYAQHQRDVFIRKADLTNLSVGSYVSFNCEINRQNKPQAKDVAVMSPPYGAFMPSGDGKGKGKGKGKDGKGKGKDGKGKGKEGKEGK